MIVVVGGQARKVGKTTTVCQILAATPEARWLAYKVSPHAHEPSSSGDSERYLAAGAAEGYLVAALPLPLPEGRNMIIESNSVLDQVEPDLVVFVADPPTADYKTSARPLESRADYVIVSRGGTPADLIAAIRSRLSSAT